MLFYFTHVIGVFALYWCLTSDYISLLSIAKELDLSETYFASLQHYQVNATPVSESTYPWVARVVHSRTRDIPHMCTAVCVETAIFITAVRCIYSLKVQYTSIIYHSQRLPARAFVIPSKLTSQAFDDIGFIVVENSYKGTWQPGKLFDTTNRTDEAFEWFKKLNSAGVKYKVVGYAATKVHSKYRIAETQFSLTELSIVVNMDLCSIILTNNNLIRGFKVPCYHSCTLKQLVKNDNTCKNYHGVEGGAVVNTKDNKIFGLATWGAYFYYYELPVGFSVVNSKDFFDDYTCARKIKNAKVMKSYEHLCK